MSGLDEQFYRCGCGRSYGWFVKDRYGDLRGWLLDPESPRREMKKMQGISLVHLYDGMENIQLDKYIEGIRYFRCRRCGKNLRDVGGIDRLIAFIRRNWNDRTVSGRRFEK